MRATASLLLLIGAFLAGCATEKSVHIPPETRHRIVLEALGQVGRPYRYGGATPEGFDCSGLVQYVYAQAGIVLPRTTREQYAMGKRIDDDELEPGDLLFYRFESGPVDHVAIYLGDGQAVHAPAQGRAVIVASIDLPYWKKRFVDAVRVLR
ncbi:NlpC/P60 family protein [Fontimonas thermophila]|uniref:NlpC/P60 family protein n=1 Tax=Fontimonas thermophila TaxID=1076937 RepID=A0A1I2ITT0_9GAMM|nr:NlpC/P60 family protein [Fontimonas thermophila]